MKKILLLNFVIILLQYSAVAQKEKNSIEFLGGLISSNFYGGNLKGIKKENLKSYAAGVSFGYSINRIFSLRPNLMYEIKGEETNFQPIDNYGMNLNGYTVFKFNYATMHLLSRATFGDKINYFVEAGPYVGYLINAKSVGISNSYANGVYYSTISREITNSCNKINIGATLGLGAYYSLNEKLGIGLNIRRSTGLNSIAKNSNSVLSKTNSMFVLAGINYKL